jgi:hypothetical protein
MNAAEIKKYVETAAGESADAQVDDYIEGDFYPMNDTDKKLVGIMEDKNIRDKTGAFADVLWNDEGFLSDFLGDKVYEIDSTKERRKVLETLSKIVASSHDAWHNVLTKIEKELIGA